ncbi:hypothetical protein AS200_20490 [Streptomyces sp. CdTB01]|nr:hypothetical protein AS200_20490 [Streptomyces sp. CdTB01]
MYSFAIRIFQGRKIRKRATGFRDAHRGKESILIVFRGIPCRLPKGLYFGIASYIFGFRLGD